MSPLFPPRRGETRSPRATPRKNGRRKCLLPKAAPWAFNVRSVGAIAPVDRLVYQTRLAQAELMERGVHLLIGNVGYEDKFHVRHRGQVRKKVLILARRGGGKVELLPRQLPVADTAIARPAQQKLVRPGLRDNEAYIDLSDALRRIETDPDRLPARLGGMPARSCGSAQRCFNGVAGILRGRSDAGDCAQVEPGGAAFRWPCRAPRPADDRTRAGRSRPEPGSGGRRHGRRLAPGRHCRRPARRVSCPAIHDSQSP